MPNKTSQHGKPIAEGSVSWGTLRTQDLLRAFAQELVEIKPFGGSFMLSEEAKGLANAIDAGEEGAEEAGAEVLADLFDSLQTIAEREGMIFGAHESDGADFGFWRIDDEDDA